MDQSLFKTLKSVALNATAYQLDLFYTISISLNLCFQLNSGFRKEAKLFEPNGSHYFRLI